MQSIQLLPRSDTYLTRRFESLFNLVFREEVIIMIADFITLYLLLNKPT
jgi:hypothetical protein